MIYGIGFERNIREHIRDLFSAETSRRLIQNPGAFFIFEIVSSVPPSTLTIERGDILPRRFKATPESSGVLNYTPTAKGNFQNPEGLRKGGRGCCHYGSHLRHSNDSEYAAVLRSW
jgi:hypothetical protein